MKKSLKRNSSEYSLEYRHTLNPPNTLISNMSNDDGTSNSLDEYF